MLVGKKRSSINLSLFTNFSESFSSSSDHGSKSPNFSSTKSPRNFQDRVVGLGIVVAMSDDSHEALRASKTSRGAVAAAAAAARSKPIPIISSNPIVKIPKPIVNKEEMELSESYTCVIAHLENGNSVKKREYFDFPDEDNSWGGGGGGDATGVFFTSPPMKTGMLSVFGDGDFLSSCYLCRKKLLGLDIFMYRGDKAFCSAECRYHQIKSDERKAKRGSGPLKAFDYSVTPCSAPRFVSPGVVAA